MPIVVDYDQRQSVIIEAMWRVVSRDGFPGVTVRSIAAEAGMSRAMVDRAFGSRVEMLCVAADRQADMVIERLSQLSQNAEPSLELLVEGGMLAVPFTAERRKQATIWIAALEAASYEPRAASALDRMNTALRGAIAVELERYRLAGLIRPDIDVAREAIHAHALLDGLAVHAATSPTPLAEQTVREIVTSYVNGLT